MIPFLTAAGLALCATITGNPSPVWQECYLALEHYGPARDWRGYAPTFMLYSPPEPATLKGYTCFPIARYGETWIQRGEIVWCNRPAMVTWLDGGKWEWRFEENRKWVRP